MLQHSNRTSLWSALSGIGNLSGSFLWGVDGTVALGDLVHGSALSGRREELRGRSVLIATTDQLTAALALIELDGVARRLVLCPSDLPLQHLPFVMNLAAVDAIVSDRKTLGPGIPAVESFVTCSPKIVPDNDDRRVSHQTEWILLTSGTTGLPKLTIHTLASLAGAIEPGSRPESPLVWSTFYDIRRYGGLQIFLRSVLTGASLVLSSIQEPTADFLVRAGRHGVTHISGTPSHWRQELMSPSAHAIAPRYIRLSGEIVDQAILNRLRSFYPQARIGHAFASTEAGVAFDVNDGLAGFPATFIEQRNTDAGVGVEMKVEDGSLRIRSARIAARYLGSENKALQDTDGFVDTGDMVELRDDRYYFVGRRDGVINVGGLKVHPEEVEGVINRHPQVRMSLVRTRKNPVTGALVVADIVLENEPDTAMGNVGELQREILQLCRNALPRHKIPAAINVVSSLAVAATGKMARQHA
jgi:acyl-coenzyme A synthetase/AMP-(fatty) acid ligase